MELDKAPPELQALASKVIKVAELLCGDVPAFDVGSGWYKVGSPIMAWFRVVGPAARKFPANSIQVVATQSSPELESSSDAMGNNMFGKPTPEFVVQSSNSMSFAGYLEFIARAYKSRHFDEE